MKIKIRALGPIHDEAQFELKPLTILIGPNNSGKTWLAYTLAALFGKFGLRQFTDAARTATILENYPPIANAVNGLLQTGIVSLDISQFAAAYGKKYLEDIISTVRKNLRQFMGTRCISFDALHMSIELNDRRPTFLKRIQETSFHASIGLGKQKSNNTYGKQNAPLIISKQKERKNISMYLTFEDQADAAIPQETMREIIEERIIWYVFRTLHRALFFDVVVLPTERTTFLTLPFSTLQLDDPETSQIRDQHIRPLSRPVSDYISSVIAVAAIGTRETAERKQQAEKDAQVQKYIDLSYLLETDILNGEVDFSMPEPYLGRYIIFHPNDCTSALEISLASSMVKELAPLVFYLRYFAQPNELLIIDEPEMNLHPKAQVQMLEFLAMLVDTGLNVLITTHSPYIIDHLSNLTQAYQHPDKKGIQGEFYLKNHQAFIDENKVSAYLIDKGTVKDALHDEELDWDTFGEISDRLSQIYFSSYQEGKEHPLGNL